jgi:hypothetical protein
MISANVIKGVNELLDEQGIRLEPGETFGERVARTLNISDQEAEILLEELHDGATVDEAAVKAGVGPTPDRHDRLVELAQAIGEALARLRMRTA